MNRIIMIPRSLPKLTFSKPLWAFLSTSAIKQNTPMLALCLLILLMNSAPSWGQQGQFRSTIVPLIADENLEDAKPKEEKQTEAQPKETVGDQKGKETKKKGKTTKKAKKTKAKKKKKVKKAKKPKKVAKKSRVWGNFSGGTTKDRFPLANKARGENYKGLIGIDYKITPEIKIGAYYSNGYSKTKTPLRSSVSRTNMNNVFAFFMYNITPKIFTNILLGYSYSPTKSVTGGRRPVNFKQKSSIFSASPSLNFSSDYEDFTSSLQMGYNYSHSESKSYTDSRNVYKPGKKRNANSVYSFLDLAYGFKGITPALAKLSPYIQGGITRKLENTPLLVGPDRTTFSRSQESYSAGSGLRFFIVNDVTINAGWSLSVARTGQLNNTYSLTLRVATF